MRDSIIAAKRDGRRKILAFGFSLPATDRESATDLPMRVAFPMLLVNTLDWFAGDQADLLTTYATGRRERVPLDGVVGATEADVKGPDGTIDPHAGARRPRDVLRLAASATTTSTAKDDRRQADGARSSSPRTSRRRPRVDIAPSTKLTLGGKKLAAPEAFAITRSQKLWWYFVLLAIGADRHRVDHLSPADHRLMAILGRKLLRERSPGLRVLGAIADRGRRRGRDLPRHRAWIARPHHGAPSTSATRPVDAARSAVAAADRDRAVRSTCCACCR